MILKNSKASKSYSSVEERSLRWRLPPISDKKHKRPISTFTKLSYNIRNFEQKIINYTKLSFHIQKAMHLCTYDGNT